VVLWLTNWVANRACGVAGCDRGEIYFAPTLIGGVGADGSTCEQIRDVAGCDTGEKCFAPTLIRGVGADWLGCIQGARCLWFAMRAKNISPLRWLVVLGLTGRVANRACGVADCDSGEKYFAPTLIGGVGAD